MKDYIGKSCKIILLVTFIIAGLSGPVMALDCITMVTMFRGSGTSSPSEATYWQRVDDTNILRVDDTPIEVF